jgi:Na+/melibiose symporter-like transporter
MRRLLRYALAIVVALVVTGGVALVTPDLGPHLILLVAIAQVYGVGTAILLRFPSALWKDDVNWVDAAFTGVTSFATLSLLQGLDGGENVPAATLGWGLVAFGFVAGIAYEREETAGDEAAEGNES